MTTCTHRWHWPVRQQPVLITTLSIDSFIWSSLCCFEGSYMSSNNLHGIATIDDDGGKDIIKCFVLTTKRYWAVFYVTISRCKAPRSTTPPIWIPTEITSIFQWCIWEGHWPLSCEIKPNFRPKKTCCLSCSNIHVSHIIITSRRPLARLIWKQILLCVQLTHNLRSLATYCFCCVSLNRKVYN